MVPSNVVIGEAAKRFRSRVAHRAQRLLLVAVALTVVGLASTDAFAAKNVVVLSSFERSRPTEELIFTGISSVFDTSREPIEVFSEYIDAGRFGSQSNEARMAAFLRDKYADVPVDLVISIGSDSTAFVARHREATFPGVRWVFSGVRDSIFGAAEAMPPNATGVFIHFDLLETLEFALALQPDATRLTVVAGAADLDRAWISLARERLRSFENRLAVTYLVGEPLARLIEELGRVPRDSIVIFLSMIRDGDGRNFRVPDQVGPLFAATAAPSYSVDETMFGHGVVGGYMNRYADIGAQTGRLALRVLEAGNAVQLPPPEHAEKPEFAVDWRQLQRWGFDASRLPPGTVVGFREASVWQQYRVQIIAVIVVVLLQAAAIVALLWLRVRNRRAERALQHSEERYRDVVEAQTDLICRYLPDGTLTFVNDAYCRYFGKSREELVGKNYLEFIPEWERAASLAHTQSLLGGPATKGIEHRVLKPDGSVGWQHWVDHVTIGANGATELQGVGRDITQLKVAEAEVAQRREQVMHLTRVALLGELSGALAHELNQPLAAILMNVQSAQNMLKQNRIDVVEFGAILEDVANDNRRASEVIIRLRSLLKQGRLELEQLDLTKLVNEVLALARGQLIAHHVNVVTRLAAELPVLLGDRVQLQQVLLNLLVNACDSVGSNQEGDRALTVATELADDGYLLISIADNGAGIPPEAGERIFEPFFTTKRDGLGLGLSICRSIVGAHGGRLVAANNVDRGATFTLSLPVKRATA